MQLTNLIYGFSINSSFLDKVIKKRMKILNGQHSHYIKSGDPSLNRLFFIKYSGHYPLLEIFISNNFFSISSLEFCLEFDGMKTGLSEFFGDGSTYLVKDEYIKISPFVSQLLLNKERKKTNDLDQIQLIIAELNLFLEKRNLSIFDMNGKDKFLKKFRETKDLMWLFFHMRRILYSEYVSLKKNKPNEREINE